MSHPDSNMFAPIGSVPINPPPQVNKPIPRPSGNTQYQKSVEGKKIDSLRQDKDLIDLTAIKQTNNKKQQENDKEQKPAGKDPDSMKVETEQKHKTMLSTLDQKKKELQKQKDTIEKLNKELESLNIPATKEMTDLQNRIAQVDKELQKASKIRKQKELELLNAINTVTRLADEKESLSDKLKAIIYEFEKQKQEKLKALEDQLKTISM